MPPIIVGSSATGEEIERIIVSKLLPAIDNEERHKVIISLLTLAITILKPSVTAEEIQEGVQGCSQWLCLFLSEQDAQEELLPEHEKRLLH